MQRIKVAGEIHGARHTSGFTHQTHLIGPRSCMEVGHSPYPFPGSRATTFGRWGRVPLSPPRDISDRLVSFSDDPEPWDFSKRPDADLVFVCMGTNDCLAATNVTSQAYTDALTKILQGVHGKWPNAQIVLMVTIYMHYTLGMIEL